jgi:hypothetical protein
MRRLLLTAAVALACATVAQPVYAQLSFGPQAAIMTGLEEVQGGGDLNGTFGLGGRVVLSPPIPVLSVGIVGQGVYYFPDSGSMQTFGIGGKVGLGLPLVSPYVIGGLRWARSGPDGGDSTTESGGTIGAGVELNLPAAPFGIFLEGTMEFNDELTGFPGAEDIDVNPLVIQAGVMFGG